MKISLNWLKSFIELNNSPEEISNLLTEVGLEVESIEKLGNEKSKLNDLVIGERGTLENNLLKEQFIKFGLSISYDSIWFLKRQYD